MDDFDRLRGSDDGRDALEEPLTDYHPRSRAPWIGLILLLTAVAIGLWWWAPRSTPTPAPVVATPPVPAATEPPADPRSGLGIGDPDPSLPELGDLDGYVRPILAALSSRPELAALLASDGLVRRFVVSVEAVARGASPAGQVRAVAPRGAFRVTTLNGMTVVDPASYARYDGLVRMVGDLDPERLARIYGRLKPRLEQAHAELGVEGTFDQLMERAIRHLLDTPDPPTSARVQPGKGTNYVYSDPALEGLSAAQRQLMRLGPARTARVKEKLRAFGRSAGDPRGSPQVGTPRRPRRRPVGPAGPRPTPGSLSVSVKRRAFSSCILNCLSAGDARYLWILPLASLPAQGRRRHHRVGDRSRAPVGPDAGGQGARRRGCRADGPRGRDRPGRQGHRAVRQRRALLPGEPRRAQRCRARSRRASAAVAGSGPLPRPDAALRRRLCQVTGLPCPGHRPGPHRRRVGGGAAAEAAGARDAARGLARAEAG